MINKIKDKELSDITRLFFLDHFFANHYIIDTRSSYSRLNWRAFPFLRLR